MTSSFIPEGYHSVTPYLIVDGAEAAIRFYIEAFGAIEVLRLQAGDRIAHAEVKIGNSHVMLADEVPAMGYLGPKSLGGCTAGLMIYLEDVDTAFRRAIDAGASGERAVADQFYGDRSGTLVDPFGHRWTLATNVEQVDEAEIKRRMAAMTSEPA